MQGEFPCIHIMNRTSLDIIGYRNRPIANEYITRENSSDHICVILPGYRHSAGMPDLHYSGQVLFEEGADILKIHYEYNTTDINDRSKEERAEWLKTDGTAIFDSVFSARPYNRTALIGKSIGTLMMGHLLDDARLADADCVWVTPLINTEWLVQRIIERKPRSFFVIGTADNNYRPGILEKIRDEMHATIVTVRDMNHGMEIPGDAIRTIDEIGNIMRGLQEFIRGREKG